LTTRLQKLLLALPVESSGFTRAKVTQVRACPMPKSLLSIAKYKMRGSLRGMPDKDPLQESTQ
jgi:hypothetical protein